MYWGGGGVLGVFEGAKFMVVFFGTHEISYAGRVCIACC